jgi:hypothetical protein
MLSIQPNSRGILKHIRTQRPKPKKENPIAFVRWCGTIWIRVCLLHSVFAEQVGFGNNGKVQLENL